MLFIKMIAAGSVFLITCSPTESDKPKLRVQPASLTFSKNAVSDTLIISNTGGGTLSWEVTDKPDWLEVSKVVGAIESGEDTVQATAIFSQQAGIYPGTIEFTSNGGNESVTLALDVSAWVEKKNMPTARIGHASNVLDGKIYVIGGTTTSSGPAFSTLEVYDPVSDSWESKTNMTTARANFGSFVLNGKIYAAGGGERYWYDPIQTIEEYDPVTDSWSLWTEMPIARMGPTACAVNGKVYIIGGANEREISYAEVDIFDPVTNTWSTGADLPTTRCMLAAVVLHGKIYAIGGHMGDPWKGLRTVEAYDPETDTWAKKADMITGRKYFSASVVDGKIYVFGGSKIYSVDRIEDTLSSVEEYDPETDTWTEKTDMPDVRYGVSAAPYNGKVYVSGGCLTQPANHENVFPTLYEYEPGIDNTD